MDYLLNKWNEKINKLETMGILNLIINGLPSKHYDNGFVSIDLTQDILNLIINGLPSKPKRNTKRDF